MKLLYFDEQLNSMLEYKILTKEDINFFVGSFLKFLNIESHLKKIRFSSFQDKDNLAFYNWYTMILEIDYDNLINDAIDNYNIETENKSDFVLFINVMILSSLVHEITHIYQNYHRYDGDVLSNLINANSNLLDIIEEEEYNEYWNLFIVERDAIITSYEYVIILLKRFIKNERMYNFFLEELALNLTCGYKVRLKKITSPLQIVNKRFSKRILPNLSMYDIYDSLKYGFPITRDEFLNFGKEKKKIITIKNNLQG